MKKIMIRNDLIYGGGVENVLYNLVIYLADKGYKVTVVGDHCRKKEFYGLYPKEVRYLNSMLFSERGTYHSLKWFITGCFNRIYRLLYRSVLKRHFDVAIAMKEGLCMKELSIANAEKKFAWVHVDYNYLHWTSMCFQSNEEERLCMKNFDRVVGVSKATCDSIINTIGDPGNLCVLYNPLDITRIKNLSKHTEDIKKDKNKLTLISVGRLSTQKNYPLLLRVCAELKKKYQFELWIIGDGPERGELEGIIDKYGLDCIKLMGKKDNPYPYIRQADIYISSAVWESYGLAIQEALILGVPVVAIKCPAIEEVFDTRYGQLVDNSFDELYCAVEKMMTDSVYRQKCRDNIRTYYSEKELYEERLQKICNLWE